MPSRLIDSLQQKYAGQKVLILGFGREGRSTYTLLRQAFPEVELWLSDQNSVDITEFKDDHLHQLPEYLKDVDRFDVIFKTPGISANLPELARFMERGGILTSQLNEFLATYRHQTIGVTGTKGKSTTASLISHLLDHAGIPTLLAGNIGEPVFEILNKITEDTQLVIEMSSYQLETVGYSPHIAVLLNLFPEHLNYHQTVDNYLAAKSHITIYQTPDDFFIYNQDFPEFESIAQNSRAQLRPFSESIEALQAALQELGQGKATADLFPNVSSIVFAHNFLPALLAAEIAGTKKDALLPALRTFQPLPHRLQKVGTYGEIAFIDDTLATIPEATALALASLPRVDAILLGGYDRGIDYSVVVEAVIKKHVPLVLLFKPSGEKMAEIIDSSYPVEQRPLTFFVEDMRMAIQLVYEHVPAGGVVLLSPASPSFGLFKDYEDKSQQFAQYARELVPTTNTLKKRSS